MKISILPCRSAPRGPKMLFGGFLLCLLISLSAAAQVESLTPINAPLKDYAEIDFYIPTEVVVEPEALVEANYTGGREVAVSLVLNESFNESFNESRVYLHLLYPCQVPKAQMDPAALKSAIEALAPSLNQTVYSPTPLNVSGRPALWGQMGERVLVTYQPSNQTVALILIDGSLNEEVMGYLLESLQITVKDDSSPLWPGYCPGTEEPEADPAQAVSEPPQPEPVSNEERMASDMNAIREMMEAAKHNL